MALNLNDAKMYCAEKGRQFVIYFEMVYDNIMDGCTLTDSHICSYLSDMQEMINHIDEIRLRHKHDTLTIFQKLNWFYSYCEYYEDTFLQDPLKIEAYEQFINKIEINHKSVCDAAKEVFEEGNNDND